MIGVFLLTILAGLFRIIPPAFGLFPSLGFHSLSLAPWQQLLATPALMRMLLLSSGVALASALIALILALGLLSSVWSSRRWQKVSQWLSPMLAIPHVALAFGLGFLLMPSGILARLAAPLAGWNAPPDWNTLKDPMGLSLILLLVIKETPFLLLALTSAIKPLPVNRLLAVGQSLGYSPWSCWLKLIWPQLYPVIRLPLFIVLAYALSAVDIPLILGPDTPPLFSVQVLDWLQDPDLSRRLPAAAGSILLTLLVGLAMGLLRLAEYLACRYGRHWLTRGHRGGALMPGPLFTGAWLLLRALFCGALLMLLIWSLVWRWRFPDLWPSRLTLHNWQSAWLQLADPIGNSLIIGLLSSVLGTVLAIFMLEMAGRQTAALRRPLEKLLFLPMLLPQLSFLFGLQILLLKGQMDGYLGSVVLVHLLFVFPYSYLSLAGPWRHYDLRQTTQALLLARSRAKAFWCIKIPILWPAIATSLSLGFAVSMAQYLPTLFAGAGRINTVTTEAVGLASGGSRRLTSIYGLIQMALPMMIYILAMASTRRPWPWRR